MAIMPAMLMRSTASKENLMAAHPEIFLRCLLFAIQSASQGLSAPHRRVRGYKPVAIAIENACLFLDGLAG
jgi:hypothetical protein